MSIILHIDSSGRTDSSVSRQLTRYLVQKLAANDPSARVIHRDLLQTELPFANDTMISGLYISDAERTEAQKTALSLSDRLSQELIDADTIVIGVPMYNFGIPAILKAYFDLVARFGLTFTSTESGSEGLLTNKKAYIVMTSGGVPVGEPIDFATPHVRQILKFVGINDIEQIAADELSQASAQKVAAAKGRIDELTRQALYA